MGLYKKKFQFVNKTVLKAKLIDSKFWERSAIRCFFITPESSLFHFWPTRILQTSYYL